ncbi:hypothetical protein HHK36_026141 [Tetracentron sinense]|uniref:Uncharacterized protein n=1 Tax=Tetracentron sinense TaxID=13715 RepID=A0A835D476_TETSI|nr:hypothetical protein HHK36_026141 [Tetracentron sinense]
MTSRRSSTSCLKAVKVSAGVKQLGSQFPVPQISSHNSPPLLSFSTSASLASLSPWQSVPPPVYILSKKCFKAQEEKHLQVVMLDEHGLDIGSEQMADLVGDAGNTGSSRLSFCIGGPYGHGRQLRERANVTIRLSSMVLNHQIALVVLLEQLYRLGLRVSDSLRRVCVYAADDRRIANRILKPAIINKFVLWACIAEEI